MRLIERNDTSLAFGLIAGSLLLFHRPLQFAFDVADDLRHRYGVDLVQALVVLAVAFGFHQYRKRQEARLEAATAAADARYARSRSEALERLVATGRALASVTDFRSLTQVLVRHLPAFIADRPHAVMVCQQSGWDALLREGADRKTMERWEAAAIDGLRQSVSITDAGDGSTEIVTVPLLDGTRPVGVIVVHGVPPLAAHERHSLEAVAALTALTIRNIQTLLETTDRSVRDALTGCVNRGHALTAATGELRRARRHRRPLSVLMFDVDKFKDVNDTYGHLAGDRLLSEIGRRLEDIVRTTDIKCRYGGDEFLVVLPDTPLVGAQHVAQSVRSILSDVALPVGPDGDVLSPTVSVGVAALRSEDRDILSLIARADHALYDAKKSGRDCVFLDRPEAAAALRLVGAS